MGAISDSGVRATNQGGGWVGDGGPLDGAALEQLVANLPPPVAWGVTADGALEARLSGAMDAAAVSAIASVVESAEEEEEEEMAEEHDVAGGGGDAAAEDKETTELAASGVDRTTLTFSPNT